MVALARATTGSGSSAPSTRRIRPHKMFYRLLTIVCCGATKPLPSVILRQPLTDDERDGVNSLDATIHEQIRNALVDDLVLNTFGIDHRTVRDDLPDGERGLLVVWSEEWFGSASGLLGTVTIEPRRVDDTCRRVILDRVEVVLANLSSHGPVQRVRRSTERSNEFDVLGHPNL
ncbi:hypothetical protein ACLFMI_14580 [Pseudonocardia nantongensis]|uniref:hypothetical protein n=1 Tax=Pseudonocardia nantongensis TaxID=1181885 RepID=UPI0039785D8C